MRNVLLVALVMAGATGCATLRAASTRSTEELLSAAGFHMLAADTPETVAQLESLPPRRIATRASNGQMSYVYPDPDVCKCLYVGTESQYQQYQKLRVERDLAERDLADQRALEWTRWPWWPD
jgi:hypothetical protein